MTQSVFWGCHKMCYYNAAMTLNARNCHNVVYFKHYICIISSNKFMFLSRNKRRRNIKVAAEKSKKYSNPFYCCFSGDKFWSACRNLFIVRLRQAAFNCGPSSHPDFIKNYFLLTLMLEFFESGLEAPLMWGIGERKRRWRARKGQKWKGREEL